LSTAVAEEIRQDHLSKSQVEDNFVLAQTNELEQECQSNVGPQMLVDAEAAENTAETSTIIEDANIGSSTTQADSRVHDIPAAVKVEPSLEVEAPEQDELPETPTSFKMTEELFRAAKHAEPGSPASFWSHTLYRSQEEPGAKPRRPTVHYCRSLATTERVLQAYFMDQKVIGFDIEWRPEHGQAASSGFYMRNKTARQNVSLIQIACEDRIALFHVALYAKGNETAHLVAPTLKRILEDPQVTKVGVAIKADCTRVQKYLNIQTKGMFELSHLNKLVKFSKTKNFDKINKSLVSLAKQVQEHLHLPMNKGNNVRSSDWSKPLDLTQISYAAADSYAGFQLYHTMELKRKALIPTPPCPHHVELNMPIRFAEGIEIPVDGELEDVEADEPEGEKLQTAKSQLVKQLTKVPTNSQQQSKEPARGFTAEQSIEVEEDTVRDVLSSIPCSNYIPSSITDSSKIITLKPLARTNNALLERAAAQTVSHLSSLPRFTVMSAKPPSPETIKKIRAYFLWEQNPSLSFSEIGRILRNPHPLTTRQVTTDILEGIEEMKFHPSHNRLWGLLAAYRRSVGLEYAPSRQGKFAKLENRCSYEGFFEAGEKYKEGLLEIRNEEPKDDPDAHNPEEGFAQFRLLGHIS
jgi:hypothetical protein